MHLRTCVRLYSRISWFLPSARTYTVYTNPNLNPIIQSLASIHQTPHFFLFHTPQQKQERVKDIQAVIGNTDAFVNTDELELQEMNAQEIVQKHVEHLDKEKKAAAATVTDKMKEIEKKITGKVTDVTDEDESLGKTIAKINVGGESMKKPEIKFAPVAWENKELFELD